MFRPKVRLRGITHKAESNSNCLGQATVVLVRWTFQPIAALIVRHVSSGDADISDNVFHFRGKAVFGGMVSAFMNRSRTGTGSMIAGTGRQVAVPFSLTVPCGNRKLEGVKEFGFGRGVGASFLLESFFRRIQELESVRGIAPRPASEGLRGAAGRLFPGCRGRWGPVSRPGSAPAPAGTYAAG